MMAMMIAAAAAAAQPQPQAPANVTDVAHARHENGQSAKHDGMDCCKDCCKDMSKKHDGHNSQ